MDKFSDKLRKSKKWLDFNGQISSGIVKIQRLCDNAEKEADLAMKSDDHRRELLRWLDPVSFDKDLSRFRKSTSSGTCQWMLNHPKISDWAGSDEPRGRLLWVKGMPGYGKTRLAASLVHTLDVKLYFFCDTKEETKRNAGGVARTWLSQLLQVSSESAALSAASRIYGDGAIPTMASVKSVLKEILHLSPCRIVLDGLDECPKVEREDILELCTDLIEDVSLLVFSRDLPDIAADLHAIGTKWMIEELTVTGEDNQADIETYLKEAVPSMDLDDAVLENMIFQRLADGARGMFLWVRLMVEHLAAQMTPNRIVSALKDLPQDLTGVYGRILNDVPISQRFSAHRILQWIVCVTRPLTLSELETAFSIEPGKPFPDPACRMIRPKERLRRFGSMIVLEDEGPTVKLVHASLKDFLLDQSLVSGSFGSMIVEPSGTNQYLAAACLTYLMYDRDFAAGKNGDRTTQETSQDLARHFTAHPFLRYSCHNWWHHLEQSRGYKSHIDGGLQKLLLSFVSDSFRSVAWLQALSYSIHEAWNGFEASMPQIQRRGDFLSYSQSAYHSWCARIFGGSRYETFSFHGLGGSRYETFIFHGLGARFSPLHIASLFDFDDVVLSELDKGVPPDSQDNCRQGALTWAAAGGSIHSMTLLLEHGVDPNLLNHILRTPLYEPVYSQDPVWDAKSLEWHGRFDVLLLLLDAGSRASNVDKFGQTALHIACSYPEECDIRMKVIETLLKVMSLDEARLADKNSCTALDIAAERGHFRIVECLLDYGCVDMHPATKQRTNCSTALLRACSRAGNGEVVALLIEAGFDVNGVENGSLCTPLHLAARCNSGLVATLLLKNAYVNQMDKNGQIPLHYAISRGQVDSVRLLLEAGSNPLAIDMTGKTLLGLAASSDNDAIVEMMLRHLHSRDTVLLTQLKACLSASTAAQSSPHVRKALALDIDSKISMKLGLSETDVRHVLFLLKTIFHNRTPKSTLSRIVDLAGCWVARSVSRTENIVTTEETAGPYYLRSQPIRGRALGPVQKVIFTIQSHDQGWSDYPADHGTYNNSHTSFEMHIFRQGNPEALPEKPYIVTNVHASSQFHTHIVIWMQEMSDLNVDERSRNTGRLVRSLAPGDEIAIVPKAAYRGWENHVKSAQIDIYTSFLPIIDA